MVIGVRAEYPCVRALKQFGTIGAARPYQHGRQSPVPGPPVRERGLVNRHLLEASSLRGPVPCDHPQAGRPPGARTHPGLGPGDFFTTASWTFTAGERYFAHSPGHLSNREFLCCCSITEIDRVLWPDTG